MFKITRFVLNPFQENTYLLYDEATRDAIIVDPGMYYDEEKEAVAKFISDNRLHLIQIVNTHLHLDHCFGADWVKENYGVPLAANAGDAALGAALPDQCRRFGIRNGAKALAIDTPLEAGDIVRVGESRLQVIHVPGHSPGGIALYCEAQNFVIVGDSLFKGSIGRTDLDGGDHVTLIKAIDNGLMCLPDNTTVLSGHGEPTTIGYERAHNPFI